MKILAWKGAKVFDDGLDRFASAVIEFDNPKDDGHRFALFGLKNEDYGREPIFSHTPLQFLKFGGWEEMFDKNESEEVKKRCMARVHHHLKAVGWDEEDSPAAP